MNIKEKLKNQKGFMSVEALFGLTAILMALILVIGFFTYMIPRQQMEQEVNLLGRTAKLNGGLTVGQVANFKKNFEKFGYTSAELQDSVTVKLKDFSGEPLRTATAMGLTDKTVQEIPFKASEDEAGAVYVQRGEEVLMEIRVEVPAKKQGLMGAMSFFNMGKDTVSDTYVFKERVLSERN